MKNSNLPIRIFSNRYDIQVVGNSSDGDTRLLCAMKSVMKFGLTPESDLKSLVESSQICVQDTIHEGTKMRNRLLNTSIVLQMGDTIVSIAHLKMLLGLSKSIHGLVESDFAPDDRQNYASVEKIMDENVLDALINNVADSAGTIMYLTLCKQITSSYLDELLNPTERVYRLWHALYFLRCWRRWIKSSKHFTVNKNFITSNLYACVEINAHALVYLIVRLRDNQEPYMFLPKLFASQPCEEIFRRLRSMGTTNYTKITYSLHEMLHLVARVDLINKIAYSQKHIFFPRIDAKAVASEKVNVTLPTDEDIFMAMKRALFDALKNAAKFKMYSEESDVILPDSSIFETIELDITVDHEQPQTSQSIRGPERSHNDKREQFINSQFVQVIDTDGSVREVHKSTFVNMLTESKGKLSSDRLKRVQDSSRTKWKKQKTSRESHEEEVLYKSDNLKVGQWALFKFDSECIENEQKKYLLLNVYVMGIVLGFRSFTEENKTKVYKWSSALTPFNADYKTDLQILGSWYGCNPNGDLFPICIEKEQTNRLRNYIATFKTPLTVKLENSSAASYKIPCDYSELISSLTSLITGS